jgi:hypothetical protein
VRINAQVELASSLIAVGRTSEAMGVLEPVVEAPPPSGAHLTRTIRGGALRFGKALRLSRPGSPRARQIAQLARADFASLGRAFSGEEEKIEAWLGKTPAAARRTP